MFLPPFQVIVNLGEYLHLQEKPSPRGQLSAMDILPSSPMVIDLTAKGA